MPRWLSPAALRKLLIVFICTLNGYIGYLFLSPLRNSSLWDLPQFYFAAQLARAGELSHLYDPTAYQPLIDNLRQSDEKAVHGSRFYNRPAYEVLIFLPFAFLSYRTATILMLAGNLALLALAVWKLPRWLSAPKITRLWLFIFCPFLYSVRLGQDTLLLTLLVSYSFYLFHRKHDWEAGIVLAMAAFKPHLLLCLPVALVVTRRWKGLAAFSATGSILAVVSVAMVGFAGIRQWLTILRAPSTDIFPWAMGNIRAVGLHYGPIVAIIVATGFGIAYLAVLRRGLFEEQLAASLIAALLISPHTYLQDYSLAAVAALISFPPVARYFVLVPWLYFDPWVSNNLSPLIILAVLCTAAVGIRCLSRNSAEQNSIQPSLVQPTVSIPN